MDLKDLEINKLREKICRLEARIAELERMFGLNSSNSSKPPSSDGLKTIPRVKSLRESGSRPSGGQKGHKGHTLQQTQTPNRVIFHRVHKCEQCGRSLEKEKPSKIIKRQVFDIPEPKIEVTEHQVEEKACTCGHNTQANFPAKVNANVQYGNRIKSFAVYLANQQLIPEKRLQQIFQDIFSLPVSTASLSSISEEFSSRVKTQQEQELERLKQAPVKHMDETGFRIVGKICWLNVISDVEGTHYRASEKRAVLLDGFFGVAVHDHYKPYFKIEGVEHALCNAHHLRELRALMEIEKEPWATRMYRLLVISSRLNNPPVTRISSLYDKIVRRGLAFHKELPELKKGSRKKRPGHNLLLRLGNFKNDVLRFLTTPEVPFSNNLAEQDIRMMKVKQKISGGFRSFRGAEIFCIIRGFISTIRKRGLNIFRAIQAPYLEAPG